MAVKDRSNKMGCFSSIWKKDLKEKREVDSQPGGNCSHRQLELIAECIWGIVGIFKGLLTSPGSEGLARFKSQVTVRPVKDCFTFSRYWETQLNAHWHRRTGEPKRVDLNTCVKKTIRPCSKLRAQPVQPPIMYVLKSGLQLEFVAAVSGRKGQGRKKCRSTSKISLSESIHALSLPRSACEGEIDSKELERSNKNAMYSKILQGIYVTLN